MGVDLNTNRADAATTARSAETDPPAPPAEEGATRQADNNQPRDRIVAQRIAPKGIQTSFGQTELARVIRPVGDAAVQQPSAEELAGELGAVVDDVATDISTLKNRLPEIRRIDPEIHMKMTEISLLPTLEARVVGLELDEARITQEFLATINSKSSDLLEDVEAEIDDPTRSEADKKALREIAATLRKLKNRSQRGQMVAGRLQTPHYARQLMEASQPVLAGTEVEDSAVFADAAAARSEFRHVEEAAPKKRDSSLRDEQHRDVVQGRFAEDVAATASEELDQERNAQRYAARLNVETELEHYDVLDGVS